MRDWIEEQFGVSYRVGSLYTLLPRLGIYNGHIKDIFFLLWIDNTIESCEHRYPHFPCRVGCKFKSSICTVGELI